MMEEAGPRDAQPFAEQERATLAFRAPATPSGHATETAASALVKLVATCRAADWAGYDPYDALNSALLQRTGIYGFKLPRLAATQLLKRSPVNVRPLLGVAKTHNPKGLALFVKTLLKLSAQDMLDDPRLPAQLCARIAELRAPGPYACWGYSFPWQTRQMLVPRGYPNVVCTTFVADALVDTFDHTGDERWLEMAASAARYIHRELYRTGPGARTFFCYPTPDATIAVHNASLLAAALLLRVWKRNDDESLVEAALRAARYSASTQRADGAWPYGEAPSQQWVDNFHTGYNLCALKSIARDADTREFGDIIASGVAYYRKHFFTSDGAARYFDVSTYPIDVHCVAQSIITLLAFREPGNDYAALARSVFDWAMQHMWDERGFFYYQVNRGWTNRTPYMRWSQAWMALALATLLEEAE